MEKEPIKTIEEARTFVKENFRDKEEILLISNKLNDPMGLNMAIIADAILKAGYMPDGFDQEDGHRVYKYNKE